MACPGCCLGDCGQPIPTTNENREKRMQGLYGLDKKRSIRRAHENKAMLDFYNFVKANKLESQLLHTSFKKSKGSILTTSKDNH